MHNRQFRIISIFQSVERGRAKVRACPKISRWRFRVEGLLGIGGVWAGQTWTPEHHCCAREAVNGETTEQKIGRRRVLYPAPRNRSLHRQGPDAKPGNGLSTRGNPECS